ncbi:MAG: SDR family oxidoreductase [Bacteroidia bacterium]|nr:SDR family oxidoreductase [Bacteroidia bacterium]
MATADPLPVNLSAASFLVTGGAGFIGSSIVENLLREGALRVVVLDNLSTGFLENVQPFLSNPRFEFIRGDICNMDDCLRAFRGIDYVFHEAALGSVPRSIENPAATHNANASGFLSVLVTARHAGVKRVVYASSSSVYGDHEELPKVEHRIGKPLSPYAVTKVVNEYYADIFHRTYGMEIIGLRYFNIYGPRQNKKGEYAAAIPVFIESLLDGKPVFINGDGEQTRDFTFIDNAVQANMKAMLHADASAAGQVFNVAVGERISINEVYRSLCELAAVNAQPIHRPARAGDVRDSLADISKADRMLGYKPEVRFAEGIRRTFEWFKAQRK